MKKTCSKCKIEKDVSEFWRDKRRSDGLMGRCKSCKTQAFRVYVADRPDYHKTVYDRTREETRERHLIRKYGVTLAAYDAMLQLQNGRCAICNAPESDQFKEVFHVDHCHSTGRVRGLLCRGCNHILGTVKDNPAILRRAIAYLDSAL